MTSLQFRIRNELLPFVEQPGQYIGGEINQLVQDGDWQRAAEAFAVATSSDSVDPVAHSWYSRLLANTGRLDDSLAYAQRAMQMDPNSPVIISRVAIANFWVGNVDAASLYFGMVDPLKISFNRILTPLSGFMVFCPLTVGLHVYDI